MLQVTDVAGCRSTVGVAAAGFGRRVGAAPAAADITGLGIAGAVDDLAWSPPVTKGFAGPGNAGTVGIVALGGCCR